MKSMVIELKMIELFSTEEFAKFVPSLQNLHIRQRFDFENRSRQSVDSAIPMGMDVTDIDTDEAHLELFPKGVYSGPKSGNLAGLSGSTVGAFEIADRAYFAATGKYLDIESGRRSVQRQAELWICHALGQAGCNPADIPGASVHNYGFAIDIRSVSEGAVVAALSQNGWTRTVANEAWHWEATVAAGYQNAKATQQVMKAPGSLSRQWESEWRSARTKDEQKGKKIVEYNARAQVWRPAWEKLRIDTEQLKKDADSWNLRADAWNKDKDRYSQWINQFNQSITALQAFRQQIQAMPNGPAKNDAIIEYNRRADDLSNERVRINQAESELRARMSVLSTESAQLDSRNVEIEARFTKLSAEYDSLVALKKEIDQLQSEVTAHLDGTKQLLTRIETAVG